MIKPVLKSCLPSLVGITAAARIFSQDVFTPTLCTSIIDPIGIFNYNKFPFSKEKYLKTFEIPDKEEQQIQDKKEQCQKCQAQQLIKKEQIEEEITQKNIIKRFIESESFQDETEIFLVNDQQQKKEIEVSIDSKYSQNLNSLQLKRKYTSEECLPIILYYLGVISSNQGKACSYDKIIWLKIFLSNRAMQNKFHEVFYQFATKLGLSTLPIKIKDEKEAMTEIKNALQLCIKNHTIGLNASSAQTTILARWYLSKQKKYIVDKYYQRSYSYHCFDPIKGQSETIIIQAYGFKKYTFERSRQYGRVKRLEVQETRKKQKREQLVIEHLRGLKDAFISVRNRTFQGDHYKNVIIRSIAIIHDEERGQVELYSDKDRVFSIPQILKIKKFLYISDLRSITSVSSLDQHIEELKK